MAALIKIFACQHLLLGGIRRRLPLAPEAAHSAGRVTIPDCDIGPFAFGAVDNTAGIREERRARLLAIKELKPPSGEARSVDFGVLLKAPRLPSSVGGSSASSRFI